MEGQAIPKYLSMASKVVTLRYTYNVLKRIETVHDQNTHCLSALVDWAAHAVLHVAIQELG